MAGETSEDANKEVAVSGPGGVSLRAKGYRLVDLLFAVGAFGLVWGAWELKAHAGDSERQSAAIVKAVTDSNAATVQALKESNAATVKALQDMAAEQRKSTNAMREIACLSDPSMRNRPDARDFCRRLARDER